MAGTSRRHMLEVGVARAPQCHKWHGDGGLTPRAQHPGGPVAQRGAAIGESETVTRRQRQRHDVRWEQRDRTSRAATAPRNGSPRRPGHQAHVAAAPRSQADQPTVDSRERQRGGSVPPVLVIALNRENSPRTRQARILKRSRNLNR